MTPRDAYWGAKRAMSFGDEDIRAIVEESQFSNSEVTGYITKVLITRRDLIGRRGFRVWPRLKISRSRKGDLITRTWDRSTVCFQLRSTITLGSPSMMSPEIKE
jgi:hypothetical protein